MSSGAYRVVEIRCDADSCDHTEDDVGVSIATLRRWARERGWSCKAGVDLCPDHAWQEP